MLAECLPTIDFNELADAFVAVWNETDDGRRRRRIESLWVRDGIECSKNRVAQGHAELYERITASHARNVRDRGFQFRSQRNADGHNGLMKFGWTMVGDGTVQATGCYVLSLTDSGKIFGAYFFSDLER